MYQKTGKLELVFRKKENGVTYVPKAYFTDPMRVVSPFYEDDDGTAFLYLLNLSGGIVGGDRLYTHVILEDDSKALLTTTSANKLYKMIEGKHAVMSNEFYVGKNAVLEYIPECNIPFADSETIQESIFHIDGSSYLFTVDSVTPGRVDKGEFFSYRRYTSNVKIYVDGRLKVYEKSNLRPLEDDLSKTGLMENQRNYASIYVYHPNMDQNFIDRVNDIADSYEQFKGGGTLLEGKLAVIRMMCYSTHDMESFVDNIWKASREMLLGKPAVELRKGQ